MCVLKKREKEKHTQGKHTLIVLYDISKVVTPAIMGPPHADRVVCKVDVAVITLVQSSKSRVSS